MFLIKIKNTQCVTLEFTYSPHLIEIIKTIPTRQFDYKSKKWSLDRNQLHSLFLACKQHPSNSCQEAALSIQDFLNKPKSSSTATIKPLPSLQQLQGRKPFPHQLQAVQAMLEKPYMLLADEMGLGKTGSSVLTGELIEGRKLVVCPASLKLNWEKEIKLFSPDCSVIVYQSKPKKHQKTIRDWKEGWLIVNYDLLSKVEDELSEVGYSVIFFDEAHYLKALDGRGNPGSKRAEAALRLATQAAHVYALTGTPVPNHVKDLWNILHLLKHPLTNHNFFSFATRYCNGKQTRFGFDCNGSSNVKELHQNLAPYMIRRKKEEVTDLPEKIRSFIPVDVDLRSYHQAVDAYLANHVRGLMNPDLSDLVKFTGMRIELAKAKIQSTLELAESVLEQEDAVVIFTCYQEVVDAVMHHFAKDAVKITGSCSNASKEKAKEMFQSGKKRVIICNLQAGGVGHTLTKARTVIFNDLFWVPTDHLQAEDRIHRIGQVNRCNVYYLYANGAEMDEILAHALNHKLHAIHHVVEGKTLDTISVKDELVDFVRKMQEKVS